MLLNELIEGLEKIRDNFGGNVDTFYCDSYGILGGNWNVECVSTETNDLGLPIVVLRDETGAPSLLDSCVHEIT